MSVITIIAKPPIPSTVIYRLHKLLDLSISEIKSRVIFGAPIFDDEIFDSDYEKKSETLKGLIKILEEQFIDMNIAESLTKNHETNYKMVITKETLKNILDSADSENERF